MGLKNVSAVSFTTKVKLGEKVNLIILTLYCMCRVGSNELIKDGASGDDQGIIERRLMASILRFAYKMFVYTTILGVNTQEG